MIAIEALRAAAADPEAAARAHKAAGGRVIAYLCDNVPRELIAAAGIMPLRIHGRPAMRTGAAERVVDRLYPPDVTQRPAFVASMLDMILDGVADVADAIVIPHNRNAVQAMHRELRDAAAADGLPIPQTWYLDKAWAPGEPARAYDAAAVDGLRARIESFAGAPIDADRLRGEIAIGNAARALGERAQGLRGAGLAGGDALAIVAAFWALPAERFVALAEAALATVEPAPARTRIYLGGSPQDHPGLYDLVEACGASIVAEDHCWGARAADGVLRTDVDPLAALAERFHAFPACSIRFPLQRTIDANLARARAARADAAIFAVAERDTVQAWETPEQLAAFEAAGIRTLHLRRQPYVPDAASAEAVRAFVEEIAR
jgi:benzoyl-CoA reductase/2-hydroxyglutaryl-CoA dehydratase subunit BcrC/BadD/HgdB